MVITIYLQLIYIESNDSNNITLLEKKDKHIIVNKNI